MNGSKPKRAVIYSRVSSDDQVENTSLNDQREKCMKLITDRGWEFVEEYREEGESGSGDLNRPRYMAMRAEARAERFDVVVIIDVDRFSRDYLLGFTAIKELWEQCGVRVATLDGEIDMTDDDAVMMLQIKLSFAERERKKIVKRTTNGQRAKAAAGGWPGGEPSFGWKQHGLKRAAKAVPDEREREVIRTALNLFVKRRMTTGQVADHLNELGLHPRRAKRWEYQTVRQTFTNPTLWTGTYTWGAADGRINIKGKHHTKTDRSGNPLYGPPIDVKMDEPPLSQAEFKSIQRALARRSIGKALAAPKTQMLSGRLFGECGEHYNGVTLSAKDYDVYRCSGRRHKGSGGFGKCDCSQVRADLVDDQVWAEIVKLLGDPARLEAMAREWLEVPDDADLDDAAPIVSGLDKQIAKVERALQRATDDYYEADDPAAHRDRMDRYRAELSELRDRRAGYSAFQADVKVRVERLTDLAQLAQRAEGRLQTMPSAQRREVIEIMNVKTQLGPMAKSGPTALRISGEIDPRLFGNTDAGGPWCRSCS